jgi:hypothetical protein
MPYIQLDADTGALIGYLGDDPIERADKKGRRYIVLDVCYNAIRVPQSDGHRHSTILHMPCCVFAEYSSYARLLKKGDGILAVGERPVEPPRGYVANPICVGKRKFGFIIGSGLMRAFKEEKAIYEKNQATKALNETKGRRKKKAETDLSDDKFDEINGDLY